MTPPSWLRPGLPLLDEECPLPLDRPFTGRQARSSGVSARQLRTLRDRGLVKELTYGVYAVAQLEETIECRTAAVSLVTPPGVVATDRLAAWLHGVDALPRTAKYEPVPLEMFSRAASRTRRTDVRSGIRTLTDEDVVEINGQLVTSKLRTALDLGRLLRRYDAYAALCGFLRAGVVRHELLGSVERFKGHRGVVQLRELAPLADPRPESGAEAVMLLQALDAGLEGLEPQFWVCDEAGTPRYRLDLALPALRLAFEYQGERAHLGEDQRAADAKRLAWLEYRGWLVVEVWADDIFGRAADPMVLMKSAVRRARARVGGWRPQGEFL